ncbi:spore coat protein [Shouchella sp. 1P09AA]|uniref:spore coat protein n=2 Tax=unclassified Shouchella TaxID=2893065 RepID=UPI0039A36265
MMNQQKVQNPKIQMPTTTAMNDQDYITDMLTTEKYITVSYSIAEHEASHEAYYQTIHQANNEASQMQRTLYETMFRKGLYSLTPTQEASIQQSYQQHTQDKSQLPYQ